MTKKESVLLGGYLENIKGLKNDSFRNIGRYIKGKTLDLDDSTSLAKLNAIKRFLPKHTIKAVSSPVKNLRLIKTSDELAKMKEAYKITAKVFGEVKKVLRNGRWTEIQVAQFIRLAGLKLGADDISFPTIVASGKNAAVPHHVPTTKVLKAGESIVLDFGFKVDGYCSDFTRTLFLKSVPDKLERMYRAAENSYQRGIAAVKNNAIALNVDLSARQCLEETGYGKYFIHSLGHGTGLDVHESPHIHEQSKEILREGMVFSIEPGIYIPSIGGIRIEDLVYLKNNRANYFQKVSTKFEDMIIK